MATLMSLESSTLTSCSKFRPASFQNGIVKSNRRTVKCSSSLEEEPRKNQAIKRLVATGLALTISSSSANFAVAAEAGLLRPVAVNVAKQADKLLKDADKLTNDDSPPRFGPSRGGLAEEDSGRVAQKGGSGAIPELQKEGSDLVGQAREKIADNLSETKQRFDESVAPPQGALQDKLEDAKSSVKGFFGQAQDKVKGGVEKVTEGSGDAGENVKGLVGKTQEKVGSNVDDAFKNAQLKAKGTGESGRLGNAGSNTVGGNLREGSKDAGDKVKGFFGSNVAEKGGVDKSVPENVKTGVQNLKQGGDKVKGLFGKAKQNAKGGVDSIKGGAANPVDQVKGLFGQAQDKVDDVTAGSNNPGEKVKGLVGDARNKVQGGIDDAGENAKNLVGSAKRTVRVR